MLAFIRGTLHTKSTLSIVIEAGGLGYRIFIPINTYSHLPELGTPCHLHLSMIIREDAHSLYGFMQEAERDLFERLLTLSGIGPKTALAIVGHVDLHHFHKAIASSDIQLLSKIPGVGKKTAERLVVELRDRFAKEVPPSSTTLHSSLAQDALRAMIHLGYSPAIAETAIQKILKDHHEETDLGRVITLALQKLA